jgi:uncharacterized protein YdaT
MSPNPLDQDTMKEKDTGSPSVESTEDNNLTKETLVKLEKELRSYIPNDYLDEDEILTLVDHMNALDKQRQLTKEQLMHLDRLALMREKQLNGTEAFLTQVKPEWYDQNLFIVDGDFFDSIVDSVIEKDEAGSGLDDRELDELRESLGITTYGPGKRNRRRKAFTLAEDILPEGYCESNVSSIKGSGHRRVTRNATLKRIQEHQRQEGLDKIDALLEAMSEAKQVAPHSTGEHKRTEGDRHSILEQRKRKKYRKETDTKQSDHHMGRSARDENFNKKILRHDSMDMNGSRKRLKVSRHQSFNGMDDDFKESTTMRNTEHRSKSLMTTDIVDRIPTPRYLDWQRRHDATLKRFKRNSINTACSAKPICSQPTIPLPSLQGFDSTIRSDPPRYRYSDSTYSIWSSQLIKFLNGAGRLFAKNEFFYSDIDRAW